LRFLSRFLIVLHLFGLFTISVYVNASEPENPGMAAMNEGRHEEAYQYFSSQLSQLNNKSNPNDKSQRDRKNATLFYLAQLSLAQGDEDAAKDHIESSLEIFPNSSEEHKLAGDIYCNI